MERGKRQSEKKGVAEQAIAAMATRAKLMLKQPSVLIFDYEKDSLQRRIMSLAGVSTAQEARFKQAQRRSLVLSFRAMLGYSPRGNEDEDSLAEEALFWNCILLDPAAAIASDRIRDYIGLRLAARDAQFIVELGDAFRYAMSPRPRKAFNPVLRIMAQYWTHPEYPLWAMNNEAGSRYVGHLLGKNVSSDNFAQLVKRNKLPRFGKFPISGVKISKNGVFMGFEFSNWADGKV